VNGHKRIRRAAAALSVIIVLATVVLGFSLWDRSTQLDNHIYDVCVTNEIQDAVIVAQLEAAKRRARASLPPGSAELIYQLDVLEDGIAALEPPDEPDCNPPEGTEP
jgi:hypothetical protein